MSNFAVSIPSYLHVSHGDEDIIKDYCNCSGITVIINEEGGFDHQTSPYESDCIIDFYNSEIIKNFIFNKYISLKTSWD